MNTVLSIDTGYWRRIDALLETALALPPEERERWLDSLGEADAAHRPVLAQMLARLSPESKSFMGTPVGMQTLDAIAEDFQGDRAGHVVGPYRLIRWLGAGGMGTVWLAERADGAVQRSVALKLPRSGWSPGLAERLKHECDILSTLEHPQIARLYDAGLAANGRPYLAMENIEGVPIDEYCRTQALPLEARLRLFVEVTKAVSYAHARLVVHRDLKPANILVDSAGGIHLLDFGLAKLIDPRAESEPQLTQVTGRTFTPDYASPEQIRGGAITVGSDIYSLGVILYELLTRKRPYRLKWDTAAALEEAIAEADVPPPSSQVVDRALAKALRGDLDTILAKALRKNPAGRYLTVEAFAADIERHLRREPVLARADSLAYVAGRFVRRNRVMVGAASLVAVAVLAGLAGTMYQAAEAARERDRALFHASEAARERDHALKELRFSEATEEFTRFLLSEQTGRPVAPRELLGRARNVAAQQFADDPVLRARAQLLLATLHSEIGEPKQAEALVKEAREAALPGGDPGTLAQAECSMASIMSMTGRAKDAEAMFTAIIAKVDAEPAAYPRAYRICHTSRGNYRLQLDRPGARDDFEAALKSVSAAGAGLAGLRVRLEANLADVQSKAGKMGEAIKRYDALAEDLTRMGRANTSYGHVFANNHMTVLHRAGRFAQVEEVFQKAESAYGATLPTGLWVNFGRAQVELGRMDKAEQLLRPAVEEHARVGYKRGESWAALNLARAMCERERPKGCEPLLAHARALYETYTRPTNNNFAIIKYVRGVAQIREGDAKAGLASFEDALRGFETADDRSPFHVRTLSRLALIRSEQGDAQAAKDLAARGVALAREIAGGVTESGWVGEALLAEARVLANHGAEGEAKARAQEARRHLAATYGDSPAMRGLDVTLRSLGS